MLFLIVWLTSSLRSLNVPFLFEEVEPDELSELSTLLAPLILVGVVEGLLFSFFDVVLPFRDFSSGSVTGFFEAFVWEEHAGCGAAAEVASFSALTVGFLLRLEVRVLFGVSSLDECADGLDLTAGATIAGSSSIGEDLGAREAFATVSSDGVGRETQAGLEDFFSGGLDFFPGAEAFFSGGLELLSSGLDLSARAAAFAALVFLAFATACSLRALASLSLRCRSACNRSSSRAKEL